MRERTKESRDWLEKDADDIRTASNLIDRALQEYASLMACLDAWDHIHDRSDQELEESQNIAWSLLEFSHHCLKIALALTKRAEEDWRKGDFVSVPLITRILFEYWGAIEFAAETMRTYQSGKAPNSVERVGRLLSGTKFPFWFKWIDNHSPSAPIHVMDMIRVLETTHQIAKNDYDFLCESCHPNYLQHRFLLRASSDGLQWSGMIWESLTTQVITRLARIIFDCINGISATGASTFGIAKPFLAKLLAADR